MSSGNVIRTPSEQQNGGWWTATADAQSMYTIASGKAGNERRRLLFDNACLQIFDENWPAIRGSSRTLQGWMKVAALIREVFGNPYHRIPSGLFVIARQNGMVPWINRGVLRLSQAIDDERSFDRMPILADMIEDAGCEELELIWHLRDKEPCWQPHVSSRDGPICCSFDGCGIDPKKGPSLATGWAPLRGPHVRGCWALDLIRGET